MNFYFKTLATGTIKRIKLKLEKINTTWVTFLQALIAISICCVWNKQSLQT